MADPPNVVNQEIPLSGRKYKKLRKLKEKFVVGAVFKDVVNHTLIGRSGVNPDGFKILAPETSQCFY